ncbi:helix-turn-helix domain-containing protein [Paenibacillus albus]|uniref:DNA-binding protein n=1 Tax=Paenibacillus albus TaxID=2495582 RepID=A0A3Q8X3T6_9BACL|nr:helix-turn-helix domain-containing protein [Paenibacillus albus]AZN39549.1 DNA-binding protein [Paenibacillus albus]
MNTVTQLEHIQVSPNSRRNVLTFAEAWDEVFEKAISKDKLYAEVRAGRIPHAKIGSKILFRRDTLEAWFKQQESLNVTYSN